MTLDGTHVDNVVLRAARLLRMSVCCCSCFKWMPSVLARHESFCLVKISVRMLLLQARRVYAVPMRLCARALVWPRNATHRCRCTLLAPKSLSTLQVLGCQEQQDAAVLCASALPPEQLHVGKRTVTLPCQASCSR